MLPPGKKLFDLLPIAGAALAAAVLSIYFFSPRFTLWRLLGTELPDPPSEVVRAGDALRQLAHPLVQIDSPTNRVLEWRLFFPALGHALHLPGKAYLALPGLGALLVLALTVSIARRQGNSWLRAIATATIVAVAPWFFVSVGWLGYFDSWCVLALLLIAFGRSQWVAVATVLIAPWIDERFVLTLPLVLFLRFHRPTAPTAGPPDRPWRQLALVCAALAPWGLIRAYFYLRGSDAVATLHLADLTEAHTNTLLRSYGAGLWEGLRWGWLAVAALTVHFFRQSTTRGAIFTALFLAALAANLAVAVDFGRSASVVIPAVLFGIVRINASDTIFAAFAPLRGHSVLVIALAALNLATPARHVLGDHRIPIFSFPVELQRNDDTLRDYSASAYRERGLEYSRAGQREAALEMFDLAIKVSPRDANAIANRAMQLSLLKRWDEALASSDRALELEPAAPDLWLNRAEIRAAAGRPAEALPDVAAALRLAKPDWPRLNEAREVQRKLGQ